MPHISGNHCREPGGKGFSGANRPFDLGHFYRLNERGEAGENKAELENFAGVGGVLDSNLTEMTGGPTLFSLWTLCTFPNINFFLPAAEVIFNTEYEALFYTLLFYTQYMPGWGLTLSNKVLLLQYFIAFHNSESGMGTPFLD